jgi:hypothetical protein
MLLDKGILSIGAGKAKVKSIDKKPKGFVTAWEHYEQYTQRDKFMVNMTKKYLEITEREKEAANLQSVTTKIGGSASSRGVGDAANIMAGLDRIKMIEKNDRYIIELQK